MPGLQQAIKTQIMSTAPTYLNHVLKIDTNGAAPIPNSVDVSPPDNLHVSNRAHMTKSLLSRNAIDTFSHKQFH